MSERTSQSLILTLRLLQIYFLIMLFISYLTNKSEVQDMFLYLILSFSLSIITFNILNDFKEWWNEK